MLHGVQRVKKKQVVPHVGIHRITSKSAASASLYMYMVSSVIP